MGKKSQLIATRLEEEDIEKLRAIQQYEQRDNQSDMIRVLIRRRFLELNLNYMNMKTSADDGRKG